MENSVATNKQELIINSSEGINLLPQKSKQEIVVEERKGTFNIGGAMVIFVTVIVSIVIIGFNLVNKLEFNTQSGILTTLENNARTYLSLANQNSELQRRVNLYTSIQENSVSFKEIFDYWSSIPTDLGTVSSIKLSDDLSFTISGESSDLIAVSKLWHYLCTDTRVLNVNLKGVAESDGKASFEFEGKLNYEYFKNKSISSNQ